VRILQVTPAYYPAIGGVERHVQALSECLVAQGHDVVVATMSPRGQRPADEIIAGVEVRRFAAFGVGEAYRVPRGMGAYLRRERDRFDVIHVHNYHAAMIPLVAAFGGQPLVVTPHLNDRPHSGFARLLHYPYALIGRWAVHRASAVICVSEAERERVVSRLNVPRARTVVMPNGFDERRLRRPATSDREHGLILSVGRLQAYKRVEAALDALAALPDAYRLVVAGDGPHRAELEAYARARGVAERVEFKGRVTDEELASLYGRAQVVVNLSAAEAFGMTVLEAVAAGCHVVCSDIPAFRDLADEFPGWVTTTSVEDRETVAAAIRAAAGSTGTAPANLSSFTWTAIAGRLAKLYETVNSSNQSASFNLQSEMSSYGRKVDHA
jgi:glycosyltransferase involved in cell wall biosynthesis